MDEDFKDALKYGTGIIICGTTYIGVITTLVKDIKWIISYIFLAFIFIWLFYLHIKTVKITKNRGKKNDKR